MARKGYAGHSQMARKVMQGIGKWPQKAMHMARKGYAGHSQMARKGYAGHRKMAKKLCRA
jgi:hypothetical protein